ncbi:MAG: hypothetical protein ABIU63_01340 [Chitinophagaceae bacterium]
MKQQQPKAMQMYPNNEEIFSALTSHHKAAQPPLLLTEIAALFELVDESRLSRYCKNHT